jgi:hypothetical protein
MRSDRIQRTVFRAWLRPPLFCRQLVRCLNTRCIAGRSARRVILSCEMVLATNPDENVPTLQGAQLDQVMLGPRNPRVLTATTSLQPSGREPWHRITKPNMSNTLAYAAVVLALPQKLLLHSRLATVDQQYGTAFRCRTRSSCWSPCDRVLESLRNAILACIPACLPCLPARPSCQLHGLLSFVASLKSGAVCGSCPIERPGSRPVHSRPSS